MHERDETALARKLCELNKIQRPLFHLMGLFIAIAMLVAHPAAAKPLKRNFLLNQYFVEDLNVEPQEDICDYGTVLENLLGELGSQADVYPTENYFYFKFHRAGKAISGSLRFAVEQRDQGIVQFACYESFNSWIEQDSMRSVTRELSLSDGVKLAKLEELKYNLKFRGKSVNFQLNNISQQPPTLEKGKEKFAGRIFDESGLSFELIYNLPQNTFYYLLDQKQPVPETFVKIDEDLFVGKRTGFVFHKDPFNRHVLVAVHKEQVYANSWNDGPFDQLPENFYNELNFWDIVFTAYPELRGKVTSGGSIVSDPESIFAIWAYREYATKKDLDFVKSCKSAHEEVYELLACLTEADEA